jgi:predicted ABC-type ATPase
MSASLKRLRIFAGPNGSGKTSLFSNFELKHNPGVFVNADEIELKLKKSRFVDFSDYGFQIEEKDLSLFNKTKAARSLKQKLLKSSYIIDVEVKQGMIVNLSGETNGYEAAYVAAFIRWKLMNLNKSFSYETVMSHRSKIDEIQLANKLGYRTYLYFICTDDPLINIDRVKNRIAKGGHPVSDEKIEARFHLTLKNLPRAIQKVSRAFLFDNSGKKMRLIAETYQNQLQLKSDELPNWFTKNVLKDYL